MGVAKRALGDFESAAGLESFIRMHRLPACGKDNPKPSRRDLLGMIRGWFLPDREDREAAGDLLVVDNSQALRCRRQPTRPGCHLETLLAPRACRESRARKGTDEAILVYSEDKKLAVVKDASRSKYIDSLPLISLQLPGRVR
jgi:hypothetical protein